MSDLRAQVLFSRCLHSHLYYTQTHRSSRSILKFESFLKEGFSDQPISTPGQDTPIASALKGEQDENQGHQSRTRHRSALSLCARSVGANQRTVRGHRELSSCQRDLSLCRDRRRRLSFHKQYLLMWDLASPRVFVRDCSTLDLRRPAEGQMCAFPSPFRKLSYEKGFASKSL